jgi:DNA-binding transcriptional regulator LsrR (DeoR family)
MLGEKTFGELLQYYRNRNKTLTQMLLAELVANLDISTIKLDNSTISTWERNKNFPGTRKLLLNTIKVLVSEKCIKNIKEANKLSEASEYGWLTDKEIEEIFSPHNILPHKPENEHEAEGIKWITDFSFNLTNKQIEAYKLASKVVYDVIKNDIDVTSVNHQYGDYSTEQLGPIIKSALRQKIIRIIEVQRDTEREEKLKSIYKQLTGPVIVAKDERYLDSYLIRAELVSFLASKHIFNIIEGTKVIGIGSGYTLSRMADLVTPNAFEINPITWLALNRINSNNYSYENIYPSSRYILSMLQSKYDGSSIIYPRQNEPPKEYLKNLDLANIKIFSLTGLKRHHRSEFFQSVPSTMDFKSVDYQTQEHSKILYDRLEEMGIGSEYCGEILGWAINHEGQQIPEIFEYNKRLLHAPDLDRIREYTNTATHWVVAARLYKAEPTRLAIITGIANSLVIDSEIAQYLIDKGA